MQGLVSLQDHSDQVFMRLFESSNFNRVPGKGQLGVLGNLGAFTCKLSLAKGYGSYVFFDNKTKLLALYRKTLGAPSRFRSVRALDLQAAAKRSNQPFSQKQSLSAMIKEAKNVDFYTMGRQPSEQDFARISEWIKRDKKKQAARKSKPTTGLKPLIS